MNKEDNMTVLVTGGAGFIASHITDILVESGYETIVVDNLSTGNRSNVNRRCIFYEEDITSPNLKRIFETHQPEYVIHHAAQIDVQKSLNDPVYDAKTNIEGSINLLECCRKYSVRKIIYASSAAVYGEPKYLGIDELHPVNPLSFYGISKHTPEHYIGVYHELYGLEYTILRYANVYGIRQDPKGEGGVVSIFLDKLLKNETPLIYGDGKQTRDFIYVKDIAKANLCAIENGRNEILNIGTGKPTSVIELFECMANLLRSPVKPVYGEKRKGDILHSYFNVDKANRILNWKASWSFDKGLKETVEYYAGKAGL